MSQKSQAVPSHRAFETLHIIFLIKSLTIPYVRTKKEGRHIEGGEDVRKCEKEKREGPGVQKKKKGSVKSLGGVCVRKIKIKGKTKRRRRTVGHIRE